MAGLHDQDLFATLAEISDGMVFVTDLEANESLWINERLEVLTGYSLEDYGFKRVENPFIPAEDIAHVAAFTQAFLASQDRISGLVRNRFVDRWGATLHVRSKLAKITWQGRPALLYFTVVEDPERDRPLQVEQRYRSLVEAATDAIVRLRPDFTFQFSNDCFQEMVGYRPVQLRSKGLPALLDARHREAVLMHLRGAADRFHFSAPLRHRDGHEVYLDGTFVRISEGEDAGMWQAILRDMTQQRLLDARVQRSQKLEGLSRMAGGIAHDLNNILTGILGAATLVEDQVEPDGMVARSLATIRAAAERAGKLSSSLLGYAGGGTAERRTVDLVQLLGEVEPLLRSSIGRRVDLRFQLPPEPIAVAADEVQLHQVFMNLVTNAAEATGPAGGSVVVEVGSWPRLQEADAEAHVFGEPPADGPVAWVRVRDQGSGMSPEVLGRVFEPFFSTKGDKRGLGLAAVQGILRRHGGCVRVRSQPGAGTEMEVLLPKLQGCELSTAPEASRPSLAPGNGTILVVDDEEVIRHLCRLALEAKGYRVLEAASGTEALAALDRTAEPLTAVVLDESMPGMDGTHALVQIRTRQPDVPILRVSGHNADREEPLRDDKIGFLGKPFRMSQLLERLQTLIG